jgi:ribonuclease HIII
MRKELIALGVNDSKKLSDTEIFPLAASIKRKFPCVIENFFPDEYNKYSGVTEILNRLHKKAGDYLKPGTHVVDKYPGCTAGNIREEKAESKFVEVAAASILARAAALQQLNDLSRSAGFPLPKGSTHVQAALEKLKESGLDPGKFVKLHFRNVQLILAKP